MNHKPLHIITPVLNSIAMSEYLGCEVFLKMECYQPVGSFKIRGLGLLCQKYADEGKHHFVSSSGGNAGYAVAYAGKQLAVPVTVFVPRTTNKMFIEHIKSLGAYVTIKGNVWDEAHAAALEFNKSIDGAYIPPFDHETIWHGHSSMMQECRQQMSKPDAIVVAVGGGGLACGILEGLCEIAWQDIPIYGVETEGSASLAASIKAGQLVKLDKIDTIATSLGAKRIAKKLFEWTQIHPIIPLTVSDRSTVKACYLFANHHRVLVEPACGAALSVVYDRAEELTQYSSILLIVCGGIGMTLELLQSYTQLFTVD